MYSFILFHIINWYQEISFKNSCQKCLGLKSSFGVLKQLIVKKSRVMIKIYFRLWGLRFHETILCAKSTYFVINYFQLLMNPGIVDVIRIKHHNFGHPITDTVLPHIVSALEQFPTLNSFRTFMYYDQRSQYIRPSSKKNSFRGNYMRKYGI